MRSIFKYGLLVIWALYAHNNYAQLIINEYSCSNRAIVQDQYNRYPDWVELYNPGPNPVNTQGLFLSDRPTNPLKWALPTTVVPPGGYLLIFASGDHNNAAGPPFHASFKLTQTQNEVIVLSDINGVIQDSVTTIPAQRNHSRGRSSDGANTWSLFTTPTPNASNVNPSPPYTPLPQFGLARGFYGGPQNVSITCSDPAATIRYTTNGTEPGPASPEYTGPIPINTTTVLRARAFNPANTPGFIATHTYFINVSHSLPVISLCSPGFNNLFGSPANAGIVIYGHLEAFGTNQQFMYESFGEYNKHGNDSWIFPQKGVDFITRDQCGYFNEIQHPLFATSPRPSFQRMMLKCGASDNYPFTWGNGGAHIRDAFLQSLSEKIGLKLDLRRLTHYIVYINGQYWGLYEMREKVNDADYTEFYYNQRKRDIDVLSYWGGLRVRFGSDTNWVSLFNYIINNPMTVPANYNYVAQRLDLDNMIDYVIINTWSVNTDWLNWNTMWWRGRRNPGKPWNYVLWDQDAIFNLGHNYTGVPTTNYDLDPCEYDDLFPNAGPSLGHMRIFKRLMTNPNFRSRYINRYHALSISGLDCPFVLHHFDSLLNVITPEMPAQIARWGGSMAEWQGNVQFLRNQIINRCQVIEDGLEDCYDLDGPHQIKINVWPPNSGQVTFNGNTIPTYPHTGSYFGNLQAYMSASPFMGWNFSHWETFFHQTLPDSSANPTEFLLLAPDSIIAHFVRPDSLTATFVVSPPLSGAIRNNGQTYPVYPRTETFNPGTQFNLEAMAMQGYTFHYWEAPLHTLFNDSAANPAIMTFTQTDTITAYFAQIINDPDIQEPDTLEDYTLFIPSAFTPNGDGLNDVFRVRHNSTVSQGSFAIFDRWGAELFRADSFNKYWDGTFMNEDVPVGVYVYKITYFDKKRTRWMQVSGKVTLIR
jgi:gliding motility-associated-like protein